MIYVLSDIHGQYDKFLNILEKINFSDDDEMYIIGDVIDRGDKSLETLFNIMSHDNMHMLMGNHEYEMLLGRTSKRHYELWMYNGGWTTSQQLNHISKEEMEDVFAYISKLPVIINDIVVNDKKYCLVHAQPIIDLKDGVHYLDEFSNKANESILWNRLLTNSTNNHTKQFMDKFEHTIIIGHTPAMYCCFANSDNSISYAHGGKLINVDCGCASGERLGCLRLDDMNEFYSD